MKRLKPLFSRFYKFNYRRFLTIKNGIIAGIILGLSIFVYFFIFHKLPSPYILKDYKTIPLSTQILDRKGKLLYEVYRDQKRTKIKLNTLPKYMADATIAVEDKDFYKHGGISFISGILRAIKDMALKHNLQGGSTITQQLVKSALLTPDRTIRRKIKEIILAVWTEKIFTKKEILELYLNQVPYGGASYGVEEAARTYFDKNAKDLTLDEAAILAGLPQAPSAYSPYVNPDLTIQRRNEVLKLMYEQKYITKNQYQATIKKKLDVAPPKIGIKAPHFVFYVKQQLEDLYGVDAVELQGLKVTTTLDLDIQATSEAIVKQEVDKMKKLKVGNGAALVTRPSTGEILAMVGSADYFATGSGAFNITTAQRQPGSSIKPLNYAVGIDRKLVNAATPFIDTHICFPSGDGKNYCPFNYDGAFHGIIQLRFALGNSYNIAAVKMLGVNGVEEFVASASAMTITTFKDPSRYGLSLTLGGGEVKMTEMAQAFSIFPNQGTPKKLQGILEIQNRDGKVLYKYTNTNIVRDVGKPLTHPKFLAINGKRVISPETAYIISHILLDDNARSATFGSGSYLVIPGHAVSVKTGTTNDKRDNWTIGYTPNFEVLVWVGNNDNTPMSPYLESGETGAAPIWSKIMKAILKNQPDLWPIKPENVIGRQVCTDSGVVANKNGEGKFDCPTRFEYFIKGTENINPPVIKEMVPVSRDTGKMVKTDDPNYEMKEKTVIKDKYTTYCLDCNHDGEFATPTPNP